MIIISRGQVVVDDTPEGLRARHAGARLDEIFRTLTQTDT
jgi:ABC-type Na+ transport system ATPase subunit NatA